MVVTLAITVVPSGCVTVVVVNIFVVGRDGLTWAAALASATISGSISGWS